MNGCIYRTKDGECDLWSEDGKYKAWCDMADCPSRKPSNADRLRDLSDEELAEFVNDLYYGMNENPGMCYDCDHDSVQNCKQCWLKWLRQEA